ncbi:MAG TPA: polysaccharide biosynthesis/export family protein, partial [Blastocatellia bacterium]|nr:polysaccharide biosynthesis/export family protein [Blastocatellia bacterium]
ATTVTPVAVILIIAAAIVCFSPGGHIMSVCTEVGASVGPRQESRPQEQPAPPVRGTSTSGQDEPGSARLPSTIFVTSSEDYRIGPNDVIEVRVDKGPEFSGTFRVNSTGTILMNYLGRITALNKSPDELAQMIADRLRGDYIKEPHVVVEVKQYNSRAFFIQGSVRNPGLYYIEGPPSLLKLIIIAGGLAESHGSTAFIIREIKSEEPPAQVARASSTSEEDDTEVKPKYELIKRNINGLFKGAFDQDLIIEPGDVVNIPATEVFFVAGEVNAPGQFPLREGTSLRQAISLAQGTTANAATGRGIIFREDPVTGKRDEVEIDISDVMKGKKADIAILPNDTIIVPNSKWKSARNALLNAFGYGLVRGGGGRRLPGRF